MKPTLLWLDDDAPSVERYVRGIWVTPVHSCQEGIEYLDRVAPVYAVIDLVVPQGGWRSGELLVMPGLDFADYLLSRFLATVALYSAGLTPSVRDVARAVGVHVMYHKSSYRFVDVVDGLATATVT